MAEDLITPVIVGIFAVFAALTVLGFVVVHQRTSNPRFEAQDYYKPYKKNDSYSRGGNPFKRGGLQQYRGEQRTIMIAVIAIAILALAVAFYDIFGGLLVIFLLPVVVRFIRARNEEKSRRNAAQDGTRSSY
jgi:hypothetical protein